MRIMQVASFYSTYLRDFREANPELAALPYADMRDRLLQDGFGAAYILADALAGRGHETSFVVANWIMGQARWAAENGHPPCSTEAGAFDLCLRQIDEFQPEILYVLDTIGLDGGFLARLARRPALIVGWRQASIPPGTDWRGYDLMLSGDEACLASARRLGVPHTAVFRPGFPNWVAERTKAVSRRHDLVFSGQVCGEHRTRTDLLIRLADTVRRGDISAGLALHLSCPNGQAAPTELAAFDHGPVWGMAMYAALRAGRIGLNIHIDVTGRAMNMRLLETTGVGSMLLTESDPRLGELFEPGREVETYDGIGELLEKVAYYTGHPDFAEAIAAAGQARCLKDHGMERRAAQFEALIEGVGIG